MRPMLHVAVLIVAAASAAGCVARSLHPGYLLSDVVTEPRLLGSWVSEPVAGGAPAGDTLTFETTSGGAYLVTEDREDESWTFYAHAFRAGGELYLDGEMDTKDPCVQEYEGLFVPCHALFRMSFNGDRLVLAVLQDSWVAGRARANALDPALGVVLDPAGNLVLVTGGPREVQRLLAVAAGDAGAWSENAYRRLP